MKHLCFLVFAICLGCTEVDSGSCYSTPEHNVVTTAFYFLIPDSIIKPEFREQLKRTEDISELLEPQEDIGDPQEDIGLDLSWIAEPYATWIAKELEEMHDIPTVDPDEAVD